MAKVSRTLVTGISLLVLGWVPSLGAQVNLPAERIVGVIRGGGAPLTWTSIQVITGINRTDICGWGEPDARGRFTINIAARAPECVREHDTDPALNYVLLWSGENLGSIAERNLSLDHPELLGITRRVELSWTPIPGYGPFSTPDTPFAGEILVARYWGQLLIGNRPAPAGTRVSLALGGSAAPVMHGVSLTKCAEGEVVGTQGIYWIDLPTNSNYCVRRTNSDPPITLVFMVNGEQLGSVTEGFAELGSVLTLGSQHRVNLRGQSPP